MRPSITSRPAGARRLLLTTAAVAALLAVSAPAALASPPVREFAPAPEQFVIPAGDACAFPVTFDVLVNKEYNTTHFQRDGGTWTGIAGRLVVAVSNGDKSVTLNVSGPGKSVPNADGSSTLYFLGNGLIFAPTFMIQVSGPAVLRFAPDGSLLSVDASKGHVVDVCALIS